MKNLLLVCFTLFTFSCFGQVALLPTHLFEESESYYSAYCIGVSDVNGDFKDDLLFVNNASNLHIGYQGGQDNLYQVENVGNIPGGDPWTLHAADLDNDGHNEVMVSGFYDGLKVYGIDDGAFSLRQISSSNFFAQGSNAADIDNDGMLDVFVCHDDGESVTFRNDGTGMLVETDMIDMKTNPISDNSGNYGSVWVDIDNDHDLDLYIAKCRLGVNSTLDPRRINALFINDGNNQYSEQAADFNLAIGAQSWTADFGDVDNDGDLDCFIINHDAPHQLLIQEDDGKFYDKTDFVPVPIDGFDYQGIFSDLDNDGYQDILISGGNDYVLWNKKDGTFEIDEEAFGAKDANSLSVGDLNDDGFTDVFINYSAGIGGSGNARDNYLLNATNDNHFIKINLIGKHSNRMGVGARIELVNSLGTQLRTVMAGQSYGISNSHCMIFGLGSSCEIDMLRIIWPSGVIDEYTDLACDQTYFVHEEACAIERKEIIYEGDLIICDGETVSLSVDSNDNVEWSNGAIGRNTDITETGVYFAKVTDENGCYYVTNNIRINSEDEAPTIEITPSIIGLQCEGEPIILHTNIDEPVEWSTGEVSETITVTQPELITASYVNSCGQITETEIDVQYIVTSDFSTRNDTVEMGETAYLEVEGGSDITWYPDNQSSEIIASGNQMEVENLQSTTHFYVENRVTEQEEATGGLQEFPIDSPFSGDSFNGAIIFDAHRSFVLEQVKVNTDIPGKRVIILAEPDGSIVDSREVNLIGGEEIIDLNFEVLEGQNYFLTTDEDSNLTEFGFESPRMMRSTDQNDVIVYPMEIGDICSLKTTNFGGTYYYYFYDWKIKTLGTNCLSERQRVSAVLKEGSGSLRLEDIGLIVYPTISSDKVTIENKQEIGYSVNVYDAVGKEIYSNTFTSADNQNIDISDWTNGVYIAIFTTEEGQTAWKRIIRE